MLPPPYEYSADTTTGATGTMTPAVFQQAGGLPPSANSGFVVGYKQNYINSLTSEGITITLLQFANTAKAASYFAETSSQTLKSPRQRPHPIPKFRAPSPIPVPRNTPANMPMEWP